MSRYRWAYLQPNHQLRRMIQEHRRIVDALEKGGLEEGLEATMAHLDSQEEIIKSVIRKNE